MLVLTRKRDESIIIGDNIKVTIVDVRGDQVKVGIDAPRSIPVHREEIYHEIQAGSAEGSPEGSPNDEAVNFAEYNGETDDESLSVPGEH